MAYVKGTASNFADLFNKFVSFMTTNPTLVAAGQQAEIVMRTAPVNWTGKVGTSVLREHVVFKQKGLSGQDEIYSSITTFGDTALDYYNWRINGATGFNPAGLETLYPNLDNGQIGGSKPVQGLFWNQAMTYWFFANGRRWWVAVKVSNIYTVIGAGLILPSVTPTQYPYPMAVWGTYPDINDRWSNTNDWHRGPTTPSRRSMFLRQPGGRWADFYAFSTGDEAVPGSGYRRVWPVGNGGSNTQVARLRDAPGSRYPLLPITLISFGPEGKATYGEADGLFFVPSLNNGAEDEITVNGVTYIVFQSAFRNDAGSLFALRAD